MNFIIKNATLVTPDAMLEHATLRVEHGIIQEINGLVQDSDQIIDADGSFLLPGIIDIHTDALDAEIVVRPGADIPVTIAFRELERKMSGCGFTTVYHSLHMGYNAAELMSRSKYSRQEVFETIHKAIQGPTLLNNKVHLRFEVSGVNAYEQVFELIDKGYVQLLSVMDHTPGQGQFTREHFIQMLVKMGKTEAQALLDFEERVSWPKIEGEKLHELIRYAVEKGIPVASHDDDSVEKVDEMYALGVRICEFPINLETARHAAKLGMHVIGGASNILRGGSLSGNVSIKDAVKNGSVDSLCSDYYPPAILHSVFKLYQEEGMPLNEAVNLASLHPARAGRIEQETGSIETGKNADLLLVKLVDQLPMVTHTIVRGHIVAQAHTKVSVKQLENVS